MGMKPEAEKGRLPGLIALRNHLIATMEGDVKGAETAALAGRLTIVLEQIAELEKEKPAKGSVLDEIAAKRAGRGADTKSSGRTSRNKRDVGS